METQKLEPGRYLIECNTLHGVPEHGVNLVEVFYVKSIPYWRFVGTSKCYPVNEGMIERLLRSQVVDGVPDGI